jgi:hypothetical protein
MATVYLADDLRHERKVALNQGHMSIWAEWGGSAEAQAAFPITVREFLLTEDGS